MVKRYEDLETILDDTRAAIETTGLKPALRWADERGHAISTAEALNVATYLKKCEEADLAIDSTTRETAEREASRVFFAQNATVQGIAGRLEAKASAKRFAALMAAFPVGARVRFVEEVERFPLFIVRAGMRGTIVESEAEGVYIKLDEALEGLRDDDEWGGRVQYLHDHWLNGERPAFVLDEPTPARDAIWRVREHAARVGDYPRIAICDRALNGDAAAVAEVVRLLKLDAARAASEGAEARS